MTTLFGGPVHSLKHMLSTPVTPPDWEIDGLVCKGQRVMLIGQWGAYKSWLLQDLGLSLVLAPGTWLGHFKIPARRRVLYFDKEMSYATAQRRLQRLALGRGIPIEDAAIEDYPFALVSHPRFEMSKDGGRQLLEALDSAKLDADVIMLEIFRRVLKGSENDQENVSAFWTGVDPLFKAGKTVYISHHMRKPKAKREQSRTMASGSTDILAGADGVFALERGTSGPALEHLKNRDAKEYGEGKPLTLRLAFQGHPETGPVVWSVDQARPSVVSIEDAAQRGQQAVLAYVQAHGTATTAQLVEAARPHGKERSAEAWISELRKAGKITRSAKGTYTVSPVADGAADSQAHAVKEKTA
jgi:hypothetical protein